MRLRPPRWFLYAPLLLAGCVGYRPQPLDPPALEQAQAMRDLSDYHLRSFVEERSSESIGDWPPASLDLEKLTLVGWYFSPDLHVARAAVGTAEANVLAAGGRINPSLSISSGYNTAPESAALFDFLPSFTIETAGKRGKRILVAEAQLAVARLRVEDAAWNVRSRVRSALTTWVGASREGALLAEQVDIRSEAAEMLRLRLQVGETAGPVVDVADQELQAAQATLAEAKGRQSAARAALAAATGLSVQAFSNVRIAERAFDATLPLDALPLQQVQRAGLLHRSDVRRALADYGVTEATVRLEVARQYPNVQLDPGLVFEEGFLRYVLGFTLAPPLLNRNDGPIAVAEAQRAESEARFEQLQASAIGEMEQALATYAGARDELAAANLRADTARRVESAARNSFSTGETDRLALAIERLLRVAAEQARTSALVRAQRALGALEDSVQQPLIGGLRPFEKLTPAAQLPTP